MNNSSYTVTIWSLFFLSLVFLPTGFAKIPEVYVLPIPKINSGHGSSTMPQDLMTYMITAFTKPDKPAIEITQSNVNFSSENAIVPSGYVFDEAKDIFFLASQTKQSSKSFKIFKDLISSSTYLTVSHLSHTKFPVPNTVQLLNKRYSFRNWPNELITMSSIKGADRIIYRSPSGYPNISVAQTLINDSVRETEIIIERENDSGHFDFYAYNSSGDISSTSLFHTSKTTDVIGPAPYTCLTCHYSPTSRTFQTSPDSYFSGLSSVFSPSIGH